MSGVSTLLIDPERSRRGSSDSTGLAERLVFRRGIMVPARMCMVRAPAMDRACLKKNTQSPRGATEPVFTTGATKFPGAMPPADSRCRRDLALPPPRARIPNGYIRLYGERKMKFQQLCPIAGILLLVPAWPTRA